jgi:hypothetical protein
MVLFVSLAVAGFFVWLIIAKDSLLEPLLFGTVLMGSVFVIVLELMSFAGAFSLANIRIALITSILFSSAVTFFCRRQLTLSDASATKAASGSSLTFYVHKALIFSHVDVLLTGFVLFIVLSATLFVALSSIPNNYDSMTYHLPRIEHWLQNRSLEFYPTPITRQLYSGMLAEEFILALRSLSDKYSLANTVQWLAFCGCILVVTGIARELEGSHPAQYLSAVMMSTLPMAILQSSSTQTDLVVAFFSISSVYFLLRSRVSQSYQALYGAILAAGLAFHAKGTAAVFLSGFIALYGGPFLLKTSSARFWMHGIAAMIVALLIVGPQVHRNFSKFGSATGELGQLMATVDPNWRSTMFNAARNLASNAGTQAAVPWVAWTARALNVVDSDERYSFYGLPFSLESVSLSPHEAFAPNTAHAIVLLLSMVGFPVTAVASRRWRKRLRPLARYSLAAGISILAFCMLLKWQPWITRLQLGEFALLIPPAAVAISYIRFAPCALMLVLGFQAAPAAFNNKTRPIVGASSPVDVLFTANMNLKAGYVRLAHKIVELHPRQVGLVISGDSWEFPLWYLLRQFLHDSDMPVIFHETNEGEIHPESDLVIYLDRVPARTPDGMVEIPGFNPLRLYQRKR